MNREENELSKASLQANTRYAKKIWWPIKILVYGCVRNPLNIPNNYNYTLKSIFSKYSLSKRSDKYLKLE